MSKKSKIVLNIGGKTGGKTTRMLGLALENAFSGEATVVLGHNREEAKRLEHVAKEMLFPVPLPDNIKFLSAQGNGVDLRDHRWLHVRGMTDHKVFVDHLVWEKEWRYR